MWDERCASSVAATVQPAREAVCRVMAGSTPLPASGSNTIWVESWQVTTLATDTNGPASAMAYAAHPHPLHRCMSRSSIPMWHGKERERTYRPRVQIIMEEIGRIPIQLQEFPTSSSKKRKEDELFPI